MGYERVAWIGNVLLAGVTIFLAWVPVSDKVGRWGSLAIAVVVLGAAIALFPRRGADGSAVRLVNRFRTEVEGHHNPTMAAGDHSSQINNEGGGTFHINTGTGKDE